ncbi:MAG: hypothetical protein AAF430_20980 [Myxococcota bacterium]
MSEPDIPSVEPEGTFDGLRPFAILLGAGVDMLATMIGLTTLAIWLTPELADTAAAREAAQEALSTDTAILASLAMGGACTVLGAFFGARFAGQLHVRHGGWVAVVSTAISALVLVTSPPSAEAAATQASYPLWAEITGWLMIIPTGMLGGALAAIAARRDPPTPTL